MEGQETETRDATWGEVCGVQGGMPCILAAATACVMVIVVVAGAIVAWLME